MRRVAGIDVGGTFTDLLLAETGADGAVSVRLAKVPTTAMIVFSTTAFNHRGIAALREQSLSVPRA